MIRGSLALVIWPNDALLKLPLGLLKFARLNRLNTSHRNSRLIPSRIRKALNADMSTFAYPGPVRMLRPAVPNVPSAGNAKREVSKYLRVKSALD